MAVSDKNRKRLQHDDLHRSHTVAKERRKFIQKHLDALLYQHRTLLNPDSRSGSNQLSAISETSLARLWQNSDDSK